MVESRTPRHVRRAKGARRAKGDASAQSAQRTTPRSGGASKSRPLVSGRSRLQKILAAAGQGSRRATEQFLRDGRVTVNGRTAKLGDSADLSVDVVALDGERLSLRAPSYWLLNKPVGVVTTMRDPEHRTTVAHLLPPRASDVFPVGRLDIDTSGLVLLTNDGALTQTLLHPSAGGEKEYLVVVKGEVSAAGIRRLERGMVLDDGKTKPARVENVVFDADRGQSSLRIILTEGRNRQIRRSMLVLGNPVKTLRRVRIGPLRMGRLRRAEVRPLRPGEVAALLAYVERLRAGETVSFAPEREPDRPKRVAAKARATGSSRPSSSGGRGRSKKAASTRKAGKTGKVAAKKQAARPKPSASSAGRKKTTRQRAAPGRGRPQTRTPRKGKRT